MNDSLIKILDYVEPKIKDIHENRIELKSLFDVYKTMEEIINLGETSYLDILDYYDQEFIIKTIKISNHDVKNRIDKYKTSRYLLKSKDSQVKEIPQYKESLNYMNSLFTYLNSLYQEIKLEYEIKTQKLKNQELLNKYYILLKKNNIFIEDINEFFSFLNLCDISDSDRLDIIIFINRCNIKNYITTNDLMITNDIKLSDIKKLLDKHSNLYKENYEDSKKLEMDIKELLTTDENILLEKKIYLYQQIKKLYVTKEYEKIIKYYLEFKDILRYENEFLKQKTRFSNDKLKKLIFVFDQNKSLVRKSLENLDNKYKDPILKNLLDIEIEDNLLIPDYLYNEMNLYIKDEFVVKVVYTYLEKGYVLVLGVLNKDESLEQFIVKNKDLIFKKVDLNNLKDYELKERDLILNGISIEDLVLTIDLNTLDIRMEDKDAK